MDNFQNNIKNLINTSDFNNPDLLNLRVLKDISIATHALKYEAYREESLQFLSELLAVNHYTGEAYRAATCLPADNYNDRTGLLSIINRTRPGLKTLAFNFEIVSYCNVRCPLCSNSKESGKDYAQHGLIMPFDNFKKIWDDIRPFTSLLILVGQGETFLHPDIYKILDYVKPCPVHIDTNGNAKIDVEKVINSSVRDLLFSVDGVDQRTYEKYRVNGNFDKALSTMIEMVRAKRKTHRGPNIIWKYILFKHTEPYIDEYKLLAKDIGVDRQQIVPCVVTPDNTEELIREFMPVGVSSEISTLRYVDFANRVLGLNLEHDSPHCPAGITNPQIRVNGDINICCSSFDPVGNVLDDSFVKHWSNEKYTQQRKQALLNRYALPECRACSRPHNNLGRLLDGTVLEYQKPPEPSADRTLWMKDLRIEPDYLAYLEANGLKIDIEYFKSKNLINYDQPPPHRPSTVPQDMANGSFLST